MTACASGAGSSPLGGIDMSAGVLLTVQIVVLVVMLLGLLSLLFVIFPGLTIIWLAALVYGLLSGFDLTSGLDLPGNHTADGPSATWVDQLLMGARAKKSGASWTGVVVSMLAALVFSILFPPFGGLVAALIALFAIETVRLKNWRQAGESTKEMAIGCGQRGRGALRYWDGNDRPVAAVALPERRLAFLKLV